jgi:hypothetical protein
MKVHMLETFQSTKSTAVLADEGITVSILEVEETYIVDTALGTWLIENRKAVELLPKQYGGKVVTQDEDLPELRNDDEVTEQPAPEIEPVEEPKPRNKRSRR